MIRNKHAVLNHKAGSVAVAVGAGVRLIGRNTVVGDEHIFYTVGIGCAKNNNATAGAFHFGSDILPATNGMQLLILHLVWVNRDRIRQKRPIGVFGEFLAPMQKWQDAY